MEKFEINTNLRKAHFLGQVAKETKFWSYEEDFIFTIKSLSAIFRNFDTEEGKIKAKELGYKNNKNEVTKTIEIQVGNYGYGKGTKAIELGNSICPDDKLEDSLQDGYNYRGRGLIQITGKTNYQAFQTWYDDKKKLLKLTDVDFVKNPEKVLEPAYVVLSAISFWDKNKLNTFADKGIDKKDILAISNVINSGEGNDKKVIRREYVEAAYEVLNSSESNNWHNPLDRMELRGWYAKWAPERSIYGSNIIGRKKGKHDGLDLYATVGTDIYACLDGVIVNNYFSGSYGNVLILEGNYNGTTYYFFHAHLRELSTLNINDSVRAGDVIGFTGQTGNASSLSKKQTHLHFEVKTRNARAGYAISPFTINELDSNVDRNPNKETQK